MVGGEKWLVELNNRCQDYRRRFQPKPPGVSPFIAGGFGLTAGVNLSRAGPALGPLSAGGYIYFPPAVRGLPPAVFLETAGGNLRPSPGSVAQVTAGGPISLPPALCSLSLAVLAQTAGGKFRPADHNLPPAKKITNSQR